MMIRVVFVSTLLALDVASDALAAGPSDASQTPTCRDGMVYDEKTQTCVKANDQSLNDDALLDNAMALAYAARYRDAMTVLERIVDKDMPAVQNYMGYVRRNLGDVGAGLEHYNRAIALDPNYTLARSYMGQALLLAGDRRAAMKQLDEIAARDGTTGRAYTELAKALLAKSLKTDARY